MQTVKAKQGRLIHLAYPLGGALCGHLSSAVEVPGQLPTCPRCIGIWNGTRLPIEGRPIERYRGTTLVVKLP